MNSLYPHRKSLVMTSGQVAHLSFTCHLLVTHFTCHSLVIFTCHLSLGPVVDAGHGWGGGSPPVQPVILYQGTLFNERGCLYFKLPFLCLDFPLPLFFPFCAILMVIPTFPLRAAEARGGVHLLDVIVNSTFSYIEVERTQNPAIIGTKR